jgi:hypothetical protein
MKSKNLFKDSFDSCWTLDHDSGCWNWQGARSRGYGQLVVGYKQRMYAHRFSFVRTFGEIPVGKIICHRCDNRLCVNPQHLFAGSHSDNVRDMHEKGRHPVNCVKGESHPRAKLKQCDVLVIRSLLGSRSFRALGRQFGIAPSTVRAIASGKSWRST